VLVCRSYAAIDPCPGAIRRKHVARFSEKRLYFTKDEETTRQQRVMESFQQGLLGLSPEIDDYVPAGGGEGVPIDVGRRSRSIFLQRAAKRGSSAGSSTGICCPRVGGLRFFGVPGAFENVAKVPEELRHRAVRLDGALDTLPGTLEFAGALL